MVSTVGPQSRLWTIPNFITMVRILLIGVFLVLLVREHDGWAIVVLAAAGVSDFLDGYLARRWNQSSSLGRILDPAADRLLTVSVVVGLAIRGVIPWWIVGLILARDLMVGGALLWGRRHGMSPPQVTRVGKSATFGLYVMLPLAFLAYDRWSSVHLVAMVGVVLATVLYWYSGVSYVRDVRRRVNA